MESDKVKNKRIKWSPELINLCRQLTADGYTHSEIAKILTSKYNIIFRRDQIRNASQSHNFRKADVEQQRIKVFLPEILEMDNYAICSDVHAPFFSNFWFQKFIDIAKILKIKKAIIAGDLVDLNFAKSFPSMEGELILSAEDEINRCKEIFRQLNYFDEIFYLCGNHESRLARMTDGKIQYRMILRFFGEDLANKIKFSALDKIFIGTDWLVTHPVSYSQISGSVAVRLAEKYHRHVINAHGHFVALRYDRSGCYQCCDLGGLFDIYKIDYINLRTTTHPAWNPGFAVIYNEHLYHFHQGTDWSFWERIK